MQGQQKLILPILALSESVSITESSRWFKDHGASLLGMGRIRMYVPSERDLSRASYKSFTSDDCRGLPWKSDHALVSLELPQ